MEVNNFDPVELSARVLNVATSLTALKGVVNFPVLVDTGETIIEPYIKELYRIANVLSESDSGNNYCGACKKFGKTCPFLYPDPDGKACDDYC